MGKGLFYDKYLKKYDHADYGEDIHCGVQQLGQNISYAWHILIIGRGHTDKLMI